MHPSATAQLPIASDAPARRGDSSRLQVVDIAKGIAILLMVFGHTEQGGVHRNWWSAMAGFPAAIKFADSYIYSFHMAVFFFVGGLFLERSVAKRGSTAFAFEKARTLLYPYLLWGVIGSLIFPLTILFRSPTAQVGWLGFAYDLLTGNAGWFLLCFFVSLLCAVALRRLPHWAQFALAVALSIVVRDHKIAVLYAPFHYLPFVICGCWFGSGRLRMLDRLPRTVALAGFVLLGAVQWYAISTLGPSSRWTNVPLGVVGIAMVLLLSRGVADVSVGRALAYCGEASLAIFVLSPYAQGAARELVLRLLHSTAPLPQLAIPTLLATALPALVWHGQKRLHIEWMFRWPQRKTASQA